LPGDEAAKLAAAPTVTAALLQPRGRIAARCGANCGQPGRRAPDGV